jgi:4-amino-4-deoxy-L-arabinose transferase-like glycosyltransferase
MKLACAQQRDQNRIDLPKTTEHGGYYIPVAHEAGSVMAVDVAAGSRLRARSATVAWRLGAVLLLGATLRLGLLAAGVLPFNADEAVVGLMARHILQGERPLFFYGQAYLGSLDAWLVAGAFAVLGQSSAAIRLVQVACFLGTLATTYFLALRIFRSQWAAGAAGVFLAVPAVLVTLYTTVSLGGYGEVVLIGNVLLLLALAVLDPAPTAPRARLLGAWLLLGLLGGLGFWAFPLVVVYLIPIGVYALVTLWRAPRRLAIGTLLSLFGFAIGASPWIGYTITHGSITVLESTGLAVAGASPSNPVFSAIGHVFNFLLFGLTVIWGLRPPWSARFLALPLIPFALAFHVAIFIYAIRRIGRRGDAATPGRWLLIGVLACVVLGFVFTPFGADPSGRYFLPMAAPLALFTADALHWLRLRRKRPSVWRKWFGQTLALGLVAFNWWGTVQSAADFPPGLTTQFDAVAQLDQRKLADLMAFLRANGETRGYTNYWNAYPLAFESREELIFVPRLPYHADLRFSPRDDRYALYDEQVAASPRAAYITSRNPALNARLKSGFYRLGVAYREQQIGDFDVFYALSRRVTPDELGLGAACCD